MTHRGSAIAACTCVLGAALFAQQRFESARYQSGSVPPLPVTAVGGGEVFVQLDVGLDGRVTAATPLRTTPPFADPLVQAVRDWRFTPALELATPEPGSSAPPSRLRVASKVLVAAIYRPPTLNTPTLGEAPRDVARASDEVAEPLATSVPPYPPTALNSGVVLLEASVTSDGSVENVSVIRSAPPFDAAARTALTQWRFRPAQRRGSRVATRVYVMFGFSVPIV